MAGGTRGRRACSGWEKKLEGVEGEQDKCYQCLMTQIQNLECRLLELENEKKKMKRKIESNEASGSTVVERGDLKLAEESIGVLKEENQDLLKTIEDLETKNSKLQEDYDCRLSEIEALRLNQELVVAEKNRNRLLYNDSKGNIEEKNLRIIELENELKIIRERMRSDSVNKNHEEPSSQLERS